MILELAGAKTYIAEKFTNQGDFAFIPDNDFSAMLDALIALDNAYLDEIGEDDPYDEDLIFERMTGELNKRFPAYKTYVMRFVDDYMDFMEQYLVSIDAVEWE